jgi:hypothetical protein
MIETDLKKNGSITESIDYHEKMLSYYRLNEAKTRKRYLKLKYQREVVERVLIELKQIQRIFNNQ